MAQGDNLQLQGGAATKTAAEQRPEHGKDGEHGADAMAISWRIPPFRMANRVLSRDNCRASAITAEAAWLASAGCADAEPTSARARRRQQVEGLAFLRA